jgi:hypothetical protein
MQATIGRAADRHGHRRFFAVAGGISCRPQTAIGCTAARVGHAIRAPDKGSATRTQENIMAKGQIRSTREKKKPKADKNKKPKRQPFGGKVPATTGAMPGKK